MRERIDTIDVQPPDERTVFERSLDFAPGAEREAYLDDACAGKPELRREVDALLKAHEMAGSFLDRPAYDGEPATEAQSIAERPGTVIGPYKLLQQIGEVAWAWCSWPSKNVPSAGEWL